MTTGIFCGNCFYMTPADALKIMLVGSEGDASSGKGLFQRARREQSLVFMSRRVDSGTKLDKDFERVSGPRNFWMN